MEKPHYQVETLLTLIVLAFLKYPKNIAIIDQGKAVSYALLCHTTQIISYHMQKKGIKAGTNILIYGRKSSALIASVCACILNKCPYVFIDGLYPTKRIEQIVINSKISYCLYNAKDELFPKDLSNMSTLIDIDACLHELYDKNLFPSVESYLDRHESSQDIALTFYTSGSTGIPKGVAITHKSSLNFINWAIKHFQICQEDRVASFAPMHFDLSIFDIFVTLSVGACVVIVPETEKIFPLLFVNWINKNAISIIYMVPTALISVVRQGRWASTPSMNLRTIMFAGEAYPLGDLIKLRAIFPEITLTNLYGPTETNVCTFYDIPPLEKLNTMPFLPLGNAIDNNVVYVCNAEGNALSDIGLTGEIVCIGDSVSPGYVVDGDLVKTLPFFCYQQKQGYKTGDLAEITPYGIVFLGRIDRQIKRRGYRVDVQEVESCIRRNNLVKEVGVILQDANILVACVVSESKILQSTDIIALCKEYLPVYMIPDEILFIENMPKTSTGKNDYTLLAFNVMKPIL